MCQVIITRVGYLLGIFYFFNVSVLSLDYISHTLNRYFRFQSFSFSVIFICVLYNKFWFIWFSYFVVSLVDFFCYISCKSTCSLQFVSGYNNTCRIFIGRFLFLFSNVCFIPVAYILFLFSHRWISIFLLIFTFYLLCFSLVCIIKFRFYSFGFHIA